MLNRRTFLQMSGAAGIAAMSCADASGTSESQNARPNILWLSVEDISAHLGCYGDPHAITPTLDGLAARGTLFSNAYAAAPVCAPNRSCVISGVYASTLGSHHMRSGGGPGHAPEAPPQLQFLPEPLRAAGYYCTNNSKTDYNIAIGREIWDESSATAHWRNRPNPDQPFFAVFNYVGTHESRIRADQDGLEQITGRLEGSQRQTPGEVTVPPYHADTPETRRQWANYHELITAMDYWVADMLQALEDDGLADNTIVIFWSDHGIGLPRGKRWLYDSGIHIPMIAYAPEKWRDYTGITPGTRVDRLVSCLDLAPTTLALAGVPIPTSMQGKPFLGAALDAEPQYVFAARDRMDERYDMMRMVRDKRYKYIRNYKPHLPYNQHLNYAEQSPVKQDLNRLAAENALPPGAHWMAAASKPVEELYDTETDPHEINNVAEQPEFAPILERMRAVQEAWSENTGDLGLLPEPELNRLGRIYDYRYNIREQHEAAYPGFWHQLRETASAAGCPNAANEAALVEALNSEHSSVRYWAVIGLIRQMAASTTAHAAVTDALSDETAVVAVAAAQGALKFDDHETALQTLVAGLRDSDPWVRLKAAIALDDSGDKARSAVPALREARDDENGYVVRVADHALDALRAGDDPSA